MGVIDDQLGWIDAQRERMARLVAGWAAINSGSENLAGLARMADALCDAFGPLGDELSMLDVPPRAWVDSAGRVVEAPVGRAMRVVNRPEAPRRVLLCIHMDTVYGPEAGFDRVERMDANTLRGPGVADAKGGLAVMLIALEALERSGLGDGRLGWEVLVNADEELGSPASAPLLEAAARRNHLGLLFEPALPDGSLIASRKGSGNFALVVRGRSAHAGRRFEDGRNAVTAMARLVSALDALNGRSEGLTVNIGRFEGGGPVNVVPDLAICRFNVRYITPEQRDLAEATMREAVAAVNGREGYEAEWHGSFAAPPKPLDQPTATLLGHIADCGRRIGVEIAWRDSGGVCDGNRLAAAGLVNVDTMGPRGGAIHSRAEYLLLDSLPERAKLTALLLMRLARGETEWPGEG